MNDEGQNNNEEHEPEVGLREDEPQKREVEAA